jgi:hypothetical protein
MTALDCAAADKSPGEVRSARLLSALAPHPQATLKKTLMYIANAATASTAAKIRLFTRQLFIPCSPFVARLRPFHPALCDRTASEVRAAFDDTYTAQLRKKILFMRFFSC